MNLNTKWKGIQSVKKLEKFLAENPDHFIYRDRGNKERQFWLARSRDEIGMSVDGRSVRAICYKLHRKSADGGESIEIPQARS